MIVGKFNKNTQLQLFIIDFQINKRNINIKFYIL